MGQDIEFSMLNECFVTLSRMRYSHCMKIIKIIQLIINNCLFSAVNHKNQEQTADIWWTSSWYL